MSNKNQREHLEHSIEAVSDEDIKFLIDQAFRWGGRLRADRIQVTAQNGFVKLWGSVPSFQEQQKAEQAVRETRGVIGVETHLKIEP